MARNRLSRPQQKATSTAGRVGTPLSEQQCASAHPSLPPLIRPPSPHASHLVGGDVRQPALRRRRRQPVPARNARQAHGHQPHLTRPTRTRGQRIHMVTTQRHRPCPRTLLAARSPCPLTRLRSASASSIAPARARRVNPSLPSLPILPKPPYLAPQPLSLASSSSPQPSLPPVWARPLPCLRTSSPASGTSAATSLGLISGGRRPSASNGTRSRRRGLRARGPGRSARARGRGQEGGTAV